ncbi:MAG: hypothetical protein ACRDRI_01200 [Pseudonocardiaceae bacterium]
MSGEVAVKQPHEPDGPHQLPYRDQERCTVEGRCIEGGSVYHVVVIRDRRQRGWVLYSCGVASPGVLITDDAARTLAKHLGRPS